MNQPTIDLSQPQDVAKNLGWQCPACQTCYSPEVKSCQCRMKSLQELGYWPPYFPYSWPPYWYPVTWSLSPTVTGTISTSVTTTTASTTDRPTWYFTTGGFGV